MRIRTSDVSLRTIVLLVSIGFFGLCVATTAFIESGGLDKAYILALMLCACAGVLFVTNRLAFALCASGGVFFALKAISVLKVRFLASPLMPADFLYFVRSSLMETLEHYPNLAWLGLFACIVAPVVLVTVWLLDFRPFSHLRPRWQVGLRVVGATGCCILFWSFLIPRGPMAPVFANERLWNVLSGQARLTGFFTTIHNMTPRLPRMTSMSLATRHWAATAKIAAPATAKIRPDIIVVLEESTFNPANFAACTIPQCHVQMFQPDARTRGHGLLFTHTFGGGTWVSEFAMFSGMPQTIFGPAGMYAPYVLAPRMRRTLPQLLDKLGYLTVAVYPTNGGFVNARNAYRDYGFDTFYGVKQLGLKMWHATDAQMFAAAKKVYDENSKPGQPVFMMILTLEQHGPHDTVPLSQLPAPFNKGRLSNLPDDQALNLSTYLSRVQASSKGMAHLEDVFLDRPRATVIAQFGDHLPSFGGLIRQMKQTVPISVQPYRDNLTYYMIKSNFPGPPLPQYPMLDIAYLPTMVLQAAGLPEGPYFNALSTLKVRCNGAYTTCPNKALLASYHTWVFDRLRVYR